jgi:hypothetical protein
MMRLMICDDSRTMVRRHGHPIVGHGDTLGLGENGSENQRGQGGNLQRDGDEQRATAQALFTGALRSVALDQAGAEGWIGGRAIRKLSCVIF